MCWRAGVAGFGFFLLLWGGCFGYVLEVFFVSLGFLKLLFDLFTILAIENFLLAGKNRAHTYRAVRWVQRCLAVTLEGL